MLDLVSIQNQPWKDKKDQSKFVRSLEKDLYTEKAVTQMTTAEIFDKLRAQNG